MIRLVLDTTTLISALGWKDGNPRKVFELCLDAKCCLIESPDLIKEFISVISRPKFNFISKEEKNEFIVSLLQICNLVEHKKKLDIVKEDPKDNIVLEAALEGKAEFIITGDNHLLKLKEFKGIKIITPKDFLEILENQ